MITICIIGLGQLGSNFAIEVAKRANALEMPLKFILVDDDIVEERNVTAQWFSPKHLGLFKAEAVGEELETYGFQVEVCPQRVDPLGDFSTPEQTILVDCVDNVPTRHGLWQYSMIHNIPLLSLGNSETGTGFVSWRFGGTDTNPFGLNATTPERIRQLSEPKDEEVKMPPCELTRFRGLALNTVLAGCESLFLFMGKDVCGRVPSDVYMAGLLASWTIQIEGYQMIDTGFALWSDNE